MSRLSTLLGLVAILLALVLLTACDDSRHEAEIQQIRLVYAAQVSGVCAAALEALDRNENDKARKVLDGNLRLAIQEAELIVAAGVRLEQPMPNIRARMARAHAYAAQHDPRVADAAKRVLDVLGPDPVAGPQ